MKELEKDILELIEDVQFASGLILERKHSRPLDADENDNDTREESERKEKLRDERDKKIETIGDEYPEAGAKVEIHWKKEWGFPEPDYGYIFQLPITYEDEILIDGIIHIPNPQGGEKCNEDPEWGHIDRYLDNPNIKKIKKFE